MKFEEIDKEYDKVIALIEKRVKKIDKLYNIYLDTKDTTERKKVEKKIEKRIKKIKKGLK